MCIVTIGCYGLESKSKENDGFAKELELSQCCIQSCKVILLIKLTEEII